MLIFFGQYLVERSIIEKNHLESAICSMDQSNSTIGQFAKETGLVSDEDGGLILDEQCSTDAEIVNNNDLLTDEQVNKLLDMQRNNRIRLGESLVRLGHLDMAKLFPMLEQYHQEMAKHQSAKDHAGWVTEDQVALYIFDYFPRLVQSMTQLPIKIGHGELWHPERTYDLQAYSVLSGDAGISVVLDVSEAQAIEIASRMIKIEENYINDELMDDTLAELLNILTGSVKKRAQKDGIGLEFSIPKHGLPDQDGVAFQLVTPGGQGLMILSKTK
ncbi:MAG: chemotaxis protein CheX [Deltaproteobacteria bacterium]|nr:chemotaxis protein CheX [Deltaproteobacteria bacterium]